MKVESELFQGVSGKAPGSIRPEAGFFAPFEDRIGRGNAA